MTWEEVLKRLFPDERERASFVLGVRSNVQERQPLTRKIEPHAHTTMGTAEAGALKAHCPNPEISRERVRPLYYAVLQMAYRNKAIDAWRKIRKERDLSNRGSDLEWLGTNTTSGPIWDVEHRDPDKDEAELALRRERLRECLERAIGELAAKDLEKGSNEPSFAAFLKELIEADPNLEEYVKGDQGVLDQLKLVGEFMELYEFHDWDFVRHLVRRNMGWVQDRAQKLAHEAGIRLQPSAKAIAARHRKRSGEACAGRKDRE